MIRSIYHDPRNPGGLSSINKLYEAAKKRNPNVTREQVKKYLKGEYVYNLHHPARRNWDRNKIIVSGPHVQAQADLCDMRAFAKYNNGYQHILTFIDAFSRFALARPLKSKGQGEVADALDSILQEYPVLKLQVDRGGEFMNDTCKDVLMRRGTYLFFSKNKDIKCAIVERFNRTLKSRMFKYFTLKGQREWVGVLPDLLHAYNNSIHRSIGIEPSKVTDANSGEIFKRLYDGLKDEVSLFSEMLQQPVEAKYRVGDMVKLRHYVAPMDHRYWPNYSDKYFVIARIVRGYPFSRYKLLLWEDKSPVDGSFYEEELLPVDHGEYRIEVKGQRRGKRGPEYRVHYVGYENKYDDWLPKNRIRRL